MRSVVHWLACRLGLQAPRMFVVCNWCVPARRLGTKPCDPEQDGLETGTICPECRQKHFPALRAPAIDVPASRQDGCCMAPAGEKGLVAEAREGADHRLEGWPAGASQFSRRITP